jgi:hypothetical protein
LRLRTRRRIRGVCATNGHDVDALTPADIQRMARTYIDPAKLAIVVVGDRAQVEGQLKAYGEITP